MVTSNLTRYVTRSLACSSTSRHRLLKPSFPLLPVGHHPVRQAGERRHMARLGHVAELVRGDVIDRSGRCLDRAAVEEQATRRRQRPPLLHRGPGRADLLEPVLPFPRNGTSLRPRREARAPIRPLTASTPAPDAGRARSHRPESPRRGRFRARAPVHRRCGPRVPAWESLDIPTFFATMT